MKVSNIKLCLYLLPPVCNLQNIVANLLLNPLIAVGALNCGLYIIVNIKVIKTVLNQVYTMQ